MTVEYKHSYKLFSKASTKSLIMVCYALNYILITVGLLIVNANEYTVAKRYANYFEKFR